MPGPTTSCGAPRPSVASSHTGLAPPPCVEPNPSTCSSASTFPVNPACASNAASTPQRPACPTCIGLQSVPKLALTPLAIDAAMASACAIRSAESPSSVAQAAAAPNTPQVAVECQPTS